VKPWVAYSLIRVAVFVAAFAILMVLNVPWWLSAILAGVVGFTVAYIFFGKLRDAVHRDARQRIERGPGPDPDADVEDLLER
jgi:hypothetical protein